MALKTTLAELEEIQAAITAITTGAQEVTIDGKRITFGNLDALYKREEILLARYKAEQGTGGPAINIGIPKRDY